MLRFANLGRSLFTRTTLHRTSQCRSASSWLQHQPSILAPREVPTPIVLLSASRWSRQASAKDDLSSFIKHFTTRGWTVTCLDLDPDDLPSDSSESILAAFELELKQQLTKLDTTPFPPLLIAKDLSTLIAEQYVSSNPLSALVLINPPLTPENACDQDIAEGSTSQRLPTVLQPFDYNITFPCLVLWTKEIASKLAFWDAHRIEHAKEDEADGSLDRQIVNLDSEGEEEAAGPNEVRKWAEDCGMLRFSKDIRAEEMKRYKEPKAKVPVVDPTPDWYKTGQYQRSPIGGSKKEPLLIDPKHIEEKFIRGSGPGGQAINKLSTNVQLKHIPTGMVVQCQRSRSRELNRLLARRLLSKQLERHLFGERDSVLGAQAMTARRRKLAKIRKSKKRRVLASQEATSKEDP